MNYLTKCLFFKLILLTKIFVLGQNSNQITFPVYYSNNELMDCSTLLNKFISETNDSLKVKFEPGKYYFYHSINLKSNVSIEGDSLNMTYFIFDLKGRGNLIQINGKNEKNKIAISSEITGGSDQVILNHVFELPKGKMIRIYKSSPSIKLSKWAKESIGQLFEVLNFDNETLQFNSKAELTYTLADKALIELIHPIENVELSNLIIERLDKSDGQTSNIMFTYARNCKVKNIVSNMSNFAHIEINNSLNVSIEKSDFYNSFSHGNGGKGYGVCIQNSSTNTIVLDCIFRKLRHGVVMQSGANRSKIIGNYFIEGFWEDVKLPKYAAGDIVFHGNYPYSNSIEGNICNQIVIDKSHGLNGPNNDLRNNRTLGYGIYVASKSIENLLVANNDIVKSKCLQGKIQGSRKKITLQNNRRNGRPYKSKIQFETSEAIIAKEEKIVYEIGYPFSFSSFFNPAFIRYKKSAISRFN